MNVLRLAVLLSLATTAAHADGRCVDRFERRVPCASDRTARVPTLAEQAPAAPERHTLPALDELVRQRRATETRPYDPR